MRKAKIVATIGPRSESADQLKSLMAAGIDVARINMSHGEREHHGEVISRIREVAASMERPVAIMLDLCGPKIRTGCLTGGEALLKQGARVCITPMEVEGNADLFTVSYENITNEVQPGERVLIGDGEIELEVIETGIHEVVTRVVHGGILGNHKGINLPGSQVSIPSITDKDVTDLRFAIPFGIDLVAQSFVRSGSDCRAAKTLIEDLGSKARLIAKIEKPEAVGELAGILEVADGVMVARGDLAVETSIERVPVLQKTIINEALVAQKTVITATQMLQSMVDNPRPTRAEASDVANAIMDGSDAVMLSAETAIGKFAVEAVATMDRIITAAETTGGACPAAVGEEIEGGKLAPVATALRRAIFGRKFGSVGRALAEAAVFAADEVGCRFIVVFTQSGHMARRVAALRPTQRIIALTPSELTRRQLALSWGIEPYLLDQSALASDKAVGSGDQALISHNLAEQGEIVVMMAGRMEDVAISTSMKLHRVGEVPGD